MTRQVFVNHVGFDFAKPSMPCRFSIFFCGCKQPKSIHIRFLRAKVRILSDNKELFRKKIVSLPPPRGNKNETKTRDLYIYGTLWQLSSPFGQNLTKRNHDEVALVHQRMGYGEMYTPVGRNAVDTLADCKFTVKTNIVVQKDIDVYRAVVVGTVVALARPAQLTLYLLGTNKDIERRHLGLEVDSYIQERVLALEAPRLGLDERRHRHHHADTLPEQAHSLVKQKTSVAEIAAKT